MMRRRTGFNAYQARGQLLEERQHVASLQLAADDHLAHRVDAVNLKNRLGNVETDRRNPLHGAILQIVVTTAATTSMALTCRWRSRPQHQKRTLFALPPSIFHFVSTRTFCQPGRLWSGTKSESLRTQAFMSKVAFASSPTSTPRARSGSPAMA